MINRTRTLFFRAVSFTMCFGLLNLSMPMSMVVQVGTPIRQRVEETAKEAEAKQRDLAKRRLASISRPLTAKEQHALQGSAGENPYVSGQNKWDVIYKGVNVFTGNFTTTATDLSFEGGYGIPVNVTRSYSANNADEGPFGKGWTLSADVRSTAGGVLKSSSAPIRSVPLSIKERPSLQLDDPNAVSATGALVQPVSAVIATDAGGKEETIQRDADGILTTPPWDKNTSDPVYEWATLNGNSYQILKSNKVTTPDGSVYTYTKLGTYPNGTVPWNNPGTTPEAANVLKVSQVTDRQGNTTYYSYTTSKTVSFQKANGLVSENPISYVKMPNGHQITFIWGDGSSAHPTNRIWKIRDNGSARTVIYDYTGGLLTAVTSPGGKKTSYSYGSAVVPTNVFWTDPGNPYWANPVAAQDLIRSITDARGLVTSIKYWMAPTSPIDMYGSNWFVSPRVYQVTNPNGSYTKFITPNNLDGLPTPENQFVIGYGEWEPTCDINDFDSSGRLVNLGSLTQTMTSSGELRVTMLGFAYYAPAKAVWVKTYNLHTQDLLTSETFTVNADYHLNPSGWRNPQPSDNDRKSEYFLNYQSVGIRSVKTTTSYNFQGNKLKQIVQEGATQTTPSQMVPIRTLTTEYAYWGKDKYYQQMAVKDSAGRYSFTDYLPNTAVAGSRGQSYRVYNSAFSSFGLDTSIPVPATTPAGSEWKYQLRPSNTASYAAQFAYDDKGRPTDVWKLQSTTTSPWTYVQTHTIYGADTDGSWGQASSVTEDYGGINRTTQTLHYTSWGKADQVLDASGTTFTTGYDPDGVVQSVTKTQGGVTSPVVTYTYGVTPPAAGGVQVTYGQPTNVTDNLSGVTQAISYASSGGGLGQPSSVTETNGSVSYSTAYTYTDAGDRSTATYTTPSGTARWKYADYVSTGEPTGRSRVFQTLTKLDASGNPTAEEFHYTYDSWGRVLEATFAQTPKTGFTPTPGKNWYNVDNPAASRARAHYVYDAGGRLSSVEHYWDTWNGSGFNSEAILANACTYELTGLSRGLKLQSQFYTRQAPGSSAWSLVRTENYGYDTTRDYLTSANYGDGLPNATPTWSYDAAANRNDAVTDNLNRATSLGGVAVTHDILGNRLTKGTTTYTWDALNRMTSLYNGSVTTNYTYRADGLRVSKSSTSGSTTYRYDGQMGMQDVDVSGSTTTVTNYAIGARGVDMIERVGTSTVTGFPIYDAHGNNVATLTRTGTTYSIGDQRSYDAWGGVRAQQNVGDPKLRYCASLGHKQDDESGLVYMRARYYEPNCGRFASEDPARQPGNSFVYGADNPQQNIDPSGKWSLTEQTATIGNEIGLEGGGGEGFAQACKAYAGKIAEITGRKQIEIIVELAEPEAFELGNGQFFYNHGRLLVQLMKGPGQNMQTLCHELGEAIFRAAELNGRIPAGWTHRESEQWCLEFFAKYLNGG